MAVRDFYGVVRSAAAPSLGAFQFVAPESRGIKKIWHCSLLSLSL